MLAKFALVVALARRADVVLLDEPWNALDPGSRVELTNIVRTLASEGDVMFIVSSHDLQEVESLCKRFLLLRDGMLVFDGNEADVKLKSGGSLTELYLTVANA
jgi:ABC-type multidrug transport system ATPase subunit